MVQSNRYICVHDMHDYMYVSCIYVYITEYLYMSVKVKDHMPVFT